MKKILALILTVAMVATMLAISVSAEKDVGGDDGVESFDPTTTGGQDLNIKVTDVTHKYAVDVTFNISVLTIGGSITWNVNDMKYDVAKDAALNDTTRDITVSNRSDLPVYAYATVSDRENADGITVAANKDSNTNKLTVEKATAGTATANGTATTGTITINITSDDWNSVAEYYAAKRLESTNQATDTFNIATITVTISKD